MANRNQSYAPFLGKLKQALACILILLCCAVIGFPSDWLQQPPLPQTPKKPVIDRYHGIPVTDDYQWLENWDDPAVRQWSDAENRRARSFLDALPVREPIRKWLRQVSDKTSVVYSRIQPAGNFIFAMKLQPPKNQSILVSLESLDDLSSERVIVDPNQMNPAGTTAIDFY